MNHTITVWNQVHDQRIIVRKDVGEFDGGYEAEGITTDQCVPREVQ
jgi:hypothetical protein